MSSPSAGSSSTKPSKPPKEPKAAPSTNGEALTVQVKSAKELKREKRAALVSSRPQTDDPKQPSSSVDKARAANNPGPSNPPPSSQPKRLINSHTHSYIPEPHTNAQQNLFFSHLPSYHPPSTPLALNSTKLHPIIIRLGVLMSSGALRGANARTMGMMAAFQEVIRDYECPDQAVLWKDLPVYLSPMISWLEGCRPKGVGGGNAIRWLKSEINRLGEQGGRTEDEQKSYLIDAIGVYVRDRIEFAGKVIADNAKEKIKPGDTVVTYARSSVVERVLLEAWRDMQSQDPSASFNVVIVDSRPLNEGRALLKSLTNASLPCNYVLLPLLSTILPRATLVLLGASALHSDGALYSRSGTALVAMLAKENRVPVVACVETYKFGERVVLDGVATNELGDPEAIWSADKGEMANLLPLGLMYDLTPPSLITAVCTEIGFIPPSSVPTVLGKASGVA